MDVPQATLAHLLANDLPNVVKLALIRQVGPDAPNTVVFPILDALASGTADTQAEALKALGRVERHFVEALPDIFADTNRTETQLVALRAVEHLDLCRRELSIAGCLKHGLDETVTVRIIELMGRSVVLGAIPNLLQFVYDEQARVREKIISALEEATEKTEDAVERRVLQMALDIFQSRCNPTLRQRWFLARIERQREDLREAVRSLRTWRA